jgi:hypothetical protein
MACRTPWLPGGIEAEIDDHKIFYSAECWQDFAAPQISRQEPSEQISKLIPQTHTLIRGGR